MYCLWLLLHYNEELNSCDRNHMANPQPNIFTILPFKKNFAYLCSGTMALWGQGLHVGQFCNFSTKYKESGILDLRSTICTGFRQSLIPQNCLLNCICSECVYAFFFLVHIFKREFFWYGQVNTYETNPLTGNNCKLWSQYKKKDRRKLSKDTNSEKTDSGKMSKLGRQELRYSISSLSLTQSLRVSHNQNHGRCLKLWKPMTFWPKDLQEGVWDVHNICKG